MSIAGWDFKKDSEQRLLSARERLLEFIQASPQKRDRLRRDQENIAISYIDEDEAVRNKRIASEIEALWTEVLKLVADVWHSFAPIEARIDEEVNAATKVNEDKTGNATGNAEDYGQKMLAAEHKRKLDAKRSELKELKAIIRADCEVAQMAFWEMRSLIISAWQTRGAVDEAAVSKIASENMQAAAAGVTTSFASILSPENSSTPSATASSLLLTSIFGNSEQPRNIRSIGASVPENN